MQLLFGFAGIVFAACAVAVLGYPSSSRIINGADEPFANPFVVSIQVDDFHICGGFIYSDKWIVTVASCVENNLVSALRVSINDYSFIKTDDPAEQKVSVFRVIVNEGYNATTKENDIALLELSQALALIPFKNNTDSGTILGPSCVRYEEVLPKFEYGFYYGWGLTEVNGPAVTTLRRGYVKLTGSSNCSAVPNFTPPTMICTFNNKAPNMNPAITVPCTYDEGAPLIFFESTGEQVAVGIFSFNQECQENLPSVFTRLSVHYGWLSRTAGYQPANCYSDV